MHSALKTILVSILVSVLHANQAPLFAQAPPLINLRPPTTGAEATLEADQQRQEGKIFYADGHVDVRYENVRVRADHVQYDSVAQVVLAHGSVQLDYVTQHVEAEEARYELRTGRGSFKHVHATFAIQRRPAPTLLTSPNPLYFEAEEAERLDDDTYHVRRAWMTVCDPNRPTWKFFAPEATVELRKSIRLENGNFRVLSVPILYLPYATFPAEKERSSGFTIPLPGESSTKGYILGDAFYWAPTDWMDTTISGSYYSKRGWSQRGEIRMRPWENARLEADYFGVIDRGLEQSSGPPIRQGGHEDHLLFVSPLPHGWRAVADLDQLSSLTFRLAWSETYTQAVNSEVLNTAFLTNNFNGFSANLAALSYKNFISASPQSSITLRTAPVAQFGAVDRAPFPKIPVYLSFEGFVGAQNRGETVSPFATPGFVERSEFAPSVTMPFHWNPWMSVTPSFTFRSTHYGGQLQKGSFVREGLFRNTEEFSLDVRLPAFERSWRSGGGEWKHVVEPDFRYNYVSGVEHFSRFVRFDEDDTLTDTNEIDYGITQRLFRRSRSGQSDEVVTWHLEQKYFFDPTFGGALLPNARNVFQTLVSLTPFAFADARRHFSPIVSDVTIEPGKRFDTEFILDYDSQREQVTAVGALLKLKPYQDWFLTLADFSTVNLPVNPSPPPPNFQQRSNQIRALIGYGDLTRRGWNATYGASYDFTQDAFQNQIAEVSYNGSCCGIGFEYRKFSFGAIRNENQYLMVFRIANLGSAGSLRRPERIF